MNICVTHNWHADMLSLTEPVAAGAQNDEGEEPEAEPREPEDQSTPLREGLVTLSTLPKSRWHNLSQLEIIKVMGISPPTHHSLLVVHPLSYTHIHTLLSNATNQ